MAIKNSYDISISENLKEIIESTDSSSIFYQYKNKKEIGEKIFRDLYSTYSEGRGPDGKRGRGFYLTDGSKDIGVLSQCQSLQALLLLASEFKLDFDTDYTVKGNGMTIRQIMDDVIEDLLEDKIKADDEGRYIFDASPYEDKLFTAEFSNIDAIRWVVPTFLLVLKYHAEQGEICKWEDKLIDVISYGIKYINEAFIGNESLYVGQDQNSDKLETGWNFTKKCEVPSLYYTFAVCECYISFYRTFEDHLSYQEALRITSRTNGVIPVSEEMQEYHAQLVENYEKRLTRPDPGYKDEVNKLRKRARFDTQNELVRVYKLINNGIESIEGSIYGDLEARCKAVSREIWRLVKDDFADNFFYNDLHSKISQEDIKMSTTSDALFNSVYIINSIIDAGLDEDLLNEHLYARELGNIEESEKYLREYNDLLETCQLASQKALRSYESLKKEGKEYIVDQFLIGFNENFSEHKDLIKELRKRRMRVFSLLPMLIRTNNLISEYLVRYPQANMSKYLGYILENRRKDRAGRDMWLWEMDGFFSASNYYYVAALGQFYSYYQNYEESYIKISADNDAKKKEIQDAYLEELAQSGEIAKLTTELQDKTAEFESIKQEKDKEIEKLREELANKHSPIEDAVKTVIEDTIKKQFPALFCDYMEHAAEYYAKLQLEKTKNKRFDPKKTAERDDYHMAENLRRAFDKFFVAYVSRSIYGEIEDIETDIDQKYQNASNRILQETNTCLGNYTINVFHEKSANIDILFAKEKSKENK